MANRLDDAGLSYLWGKLKALFAGKADASSVPKKTSQLTNDSGFLTSHQDISGKADKADAIKSISRSGTTFTATRANGTTFTFTQQDNNTTYAQISRGGGVGLAPGLPSGSGTTKYLREDGSWVVPPDNNTTYAVVSKSANGLCPALPNETSTTKYLRQDGTWVKPPNDNTTYAFTDKNVTLAWNTTHTIATVGGVNIRVTMPANPDTNTTYNFSGTTFYSGNYGTAEHNADNAVKNGVYYYSSNGPATSLGASTDDGGLYVQSYTDYWVGQIAQDYRNGNIFVRGKNNGTWTSWKKPDAGSINGYTVAKSVPSNAVFTDTNTTYSFTDKNVTLAWGTTHTIAVVGGVNIRLTMPANPNTNTWRGIQNNLTSTSTTDSLSAAQGKVLKGLISNLDLITGQTAGIKTIALDSTLCPSGSIRWFDLRNTDVSDLPSTSQKYGTARVNKRSASAITIAVYDEFDNVYITSYNGSTWSDWYSLNDHLTNKIKRKTITVSCIASTWQSIPLNTLPQYGINELKIINIIPAYGQGRWIIWRMAGGNILFLRLNTSGTGIYVDDTTGDFSLDIIYTDNIASSN